MRRYVHFNPDVWGVLRRFDPTCVAIWNFNPTMLLGALYARAHRRRLIVATDACLKSDRFNTPVHGIVRRLMIPGADAVVGTSVGSRDLFLRWGASADAYFNCWLVVDLERYARERRHEREYDLLFSGQLIERKLPHFFVDVVERVSARRPETSVLVLGEGRLSGSVASRLEKLGVRYKMAGFVQQADLPAAYGSARLLLFPSKLDAYGVVANEALAVGTPVICNDEPGAAGEVVLDGKTGRILPLDPERWAGAVLELLGDPVKYHALSDAGFAHVQNYSAARAAEGLRLAFAYALR